MNEGMSKRRKEERDKSTKGERKRLEKDPALWYKKRGIFILVYRRVGGVVSRGAVNRGAVVRA